MASTRHPVRLRTARHSDTQSLAPVSPSATPTGAIADPGREHAVELNESYHLGLQLGDDYQLKSPEEQAQISRTDARLARQNSIIQLLRLHHYKDKHRLQSVLNTFHQIAVGQLAVDGKTRISMGAALPSPAVLQQSLLNLLELSKTAILQDIKSKQPPTASATPPVTPSKQSITPTRQFVTPARAPAQAPPGTLARTPARTSINNALSPAIAHYLPARDAITADIDQVPVMQRVRGSALRSTNRRNAALERWAQGQGSGHTASTANSRRPASVASSTTSSDMFSAIDSFVELQESSQTSVTTAVNPVETSNDRGYTTDSTSDSYAASDDLLEAMEISFTQLEEKEQQSREASPEVVPDIGSLQITDNAAVGTTRRQSVKAKATKKSSAKSTAVPGLRDRLDGIFPSTPAWLQTAPFPIIWETTRIAMRCGVDLNAELSAAPPMYTRAWEESQFVFRTALANNPLFQGKRLPEPMSDITWEAAMNRLPVVQGLRTQCVPVYVVQLHFSESGSRDTSRETPVTTPGKGKEKASSFNDGPLYYAELLPIATDLSHRLSRHFGNERFVEVLFPSHHSSVKLVPRILKNHDAAIQEVNAWLTRERHELAGRRWAAFYVKDGKLSKKPDSVWEQTVQSIVGEAQETLLLKRVFLFAEESVAGMSAWSSSLSSSSQSTSSRLQTGPLESITVYEMLDWLLCFNDFPDNRKQPYLKLFSRIALGLSRTKPTIVFRPDQITHHQQDVLSPTGKVMNDGIGRMSLSVARKLRTALELSDLPTAVQGRIGSAKGMWILDTEDPGKTDWIETFPSQRKWLLSEGELDGEYHEEDDLVDPDQRTLEVRHFASAIGRSSPINLQFIQLVEDRAIDKPRMRRTLARILKGNLTRDLAAQRDALKHPLLFSAWVQENARSRSNLSTYGGEAVGGQVPFLGGRPDSDEDTIQFLLAGGFHPLQQRYLWDKAYDMQMQRCKRLQSKLAVRVGRAAHLLMVVDFLGVLEEGEVQINFSSKFQVESDTPLGENGEPDSDFDDDDGYDGDDGSFSDTLLVGMDVLVARSPAHFPSDMQKVRAVFRPELSALKDVVIFSTKGNVPLADKLSGGDYDGDIAWVCWNPRIVDNFENAPSNDEPINLVDAGYVRKIKTSMEDLARDFWRPGMSGDMHDYPPTALQNLLEQSFEFNMRDNLLGQITTFKEHLCHFRGSISDSTAMVLSTLVSDLVDQAKQGNVFTRDDFKRLREERLGGLRADEDGDSVAVRKQPLSSRLPIPAYKQSRLVHLPAKERDLDRIINYLKFDVAIPVIARELKGLASAREEMIANERSRQSQAGAESSGSLIAEGFFDSDLTLPACHFEELAGRSAVCLAIFDALKKDITEVVATWNEGTVAWKRESTASGSKSKIGSGTEDPGYTQRVLRAYSQWCSIGIRLPEDALQSPLIKKAPRGCTWSEAESQSIPALLRQEYLGDPIYSQWALIRASQTFRMLYQRQPRLVWDLAGRQLQVIKAMAAKTSTSANPNADNGTAGAKVMMMPLMFAASKPDSKSIRRMTARLTASSLAGGDEYEHDGDLFYDASDGSQLFEDDT